jgi:hypothetical protein
MEFDSKEICNNSLTKDIDEMIVTCGLKEMHKGKKKYIYIN